MRTQCHSCKRIFSSLAEVNEHIETYHQEVLSYNCKSCSKRFESKEPHRKHRTYNKQKCFCENDEHFAKFQNIWSNKQFDTMPT